MSVPIIDARGLLCPKPLIMTKKALADIPTGGTITVLIDNDISMQNVERFLADNGHQVSHTGENGVYTLTVIKKEETLIHPDTESYCSAGPARPHVICIKNDKMGLGSDELGAILIQAFINTIKEAKPLPGTIVFYNSGINLALNSSPVLQALKELETFGVRILVCGTCATFFEKKNEVAAGIISNMYDIAQALTDAGHVIFP